MTTLILYWGRRGSGPLHTAQLAEIATRYGQCVVSYADSGETPALLPASIITHHAINLTMGPQFLLQIPRLRAEFKALLKQHRPHNIIVPMAFAALPFLVDIPRRMGIPLTYMLHDVAAHKGDPTGWIHALPQRWIVSNSQTILCPSTYTQTAFQQNYPQTRTKVLPLLALYSSVESPRAAPQLPIRFLLQGRLQAYKGLEILAQSLALLPQEGWQLTIAGQPHDESYIRGLFSTFPQVTLKLGWLSHEDVNALYHAHDVLLAPYIEASQSGPVAQAMSQAMPCVVNDVGALAEQIGRAGWVVPPNAPDAFAAILNDLMQNPAEIAAKSAECLEMHAKAQQEAAPVFDMLFRLRTH